MKTPKSAARAVDGTGSCAVGASVRRVATSGAGHASEVRSTAWSYTRHRLLAACERAVFWTYHGTLGFGLPPRDPRAHRALGLKLLSTIPQLIGTTVHNAARELILAVLAGDAPPSHETLLDGARWALNVAWRSSQPDRIDRHWQMPRAFPALQEIVERAALAPEEVADARARLDQCLKALRSAPLLNDLRAAGPECVTVGLAGPTLIRVADGGLAAGHPVWVAHDLLYLHRTPGSVPGWSDASPDDGHPLDALPGDAVPGPAAGATPRATGGDPAAAAVGATAVWCVADLKTGAGVHPEAERLQLATYGLWLEATGVPQTDGAYLGRIVDLYHAEDRWYRIGARELETVRSVIAADVERLQERLRDPERGVPMPIHEWALAQDRRTCTRCRYRMLCADELRPLLDRVDALRAAERRADSEGVS